MSALLRMPHRIARSLANVIQHMGGLRIRCPTQRKNKNQQSFFHHSHLTTDSFVYFFAQLEAFRHSTVPSTTFDSPDLNFSSSTISRAATASLSCRAAVTKDNADCFFSSPVRFPNKPSRL